MNNDNEKEESIASRDTTSSEKADISDINTQNSDLNSENKLSRFERRKLMKQQLKEQNNQNSQNQGKKLFKKMSIYGAILLLIIAVIFLFINSSKTIWPTPDDDPYIGDPNAPLTIIEFGDFQCPYTRNFNTVAFKELMTKYDGKVKWVFKDMVTGRHRFSKEVSMAAGCASEQGKFWEFHDLAFQRFAGDEQSLKSYAQQLSLDMDIFNECYDSNRYADEVMSDYKQGKKAGVTITPTFYIYTKKNEVFKLQGDLSVKDFEPVLNRMLNEG